VSGNHVGGSSENLFGGGFSGDFNLLGSGDTTGGAGDITGEDNPLLGLLADNGGPTQTHALLPGSPAIDAGDPSPFDPPANDQRGAPFARIADGGVNGPRMDIGAFELQSLTARWEGDATAGNIGDAVSWSDANNWELAGITDLAPIDISPGENVEFTAAPTTIGSVNLESDRTVNSLTFQADYMLSGQSLTVTSGLIDVPAGTSASIDSTIVSAAGVTKTGDGALHIMGVAPNVTVTGGTLILASTGTVQDLTNDVGGTALIHSNAGSSVLGDLLNNGTLAPSGNMNGNLKLDAGDIDLLLAKVASRRRYDPLFDVVADGVIDRQDAQRTPRAAGGSVVVESQITDIAIAALSRERDQAQRPDFAPLRGALVPVVAPTAAQQGAAQRADVVWVRDADRLFSLWARRDQLAVRADDFAHITREPFEENQLGVGDETEPFWF